MNESHFKRSPQTECFFKAVDNVMMWPLMAGRPGSPGRQRETGAGGNVWPRPCHGPAPTFDHWPRSVECDCDWPLVTLSSWRSGPVQVTSVISTPCHLVIIGSGTHDSQGKDPRKVENRVYVEGGGGLFLSFIFGGLRQHTTVMWGPRHPWCDTWPHTSILRDKSKLWIPIMYPWPWWYWLSVWVSPSPSRAPWSDPFLPPVLRTLVPPLVCQFSPQCYELCHPPDILHTLTST